MDFPIHTCIDTISMGLSIKNLIGSKVKFSNYDVILSMTVGLILANSVDPDEMQHYAPFHLGLHSLQMYPFRALLNTKGSGRCLLNMLECPAKCIVY